MLLSNAVEEVLEQVLPTIFTLASNPIWRLLYALTGKSYGFTKAERQANSNCAQLRAKLTNYVRKRKEGIIESKVGAQSDILSLFLKSPEIFTEDYIVDEMIDFLLAGT